MKKFSVKLLGLALAALIVFQGCSIMEKDSFIIGLVAPSFDAATTAVLSKALDDKDALDKINMVYASAHALRTLSGGTINSEMVRNILSIWLPSKKHWAEYADSITGTYEKYFSKLDGDPKLAVAYVEQLALGIESAATRAKKKLEGI